MVPLPVPPKTAPAPAQPRPRCGAAPAGRSRQQGPWAQRPILGGAQRTPENVKELLSSPMEKQTFPVSRELVLAASGEGLDLEVGACAVAGVNLMVG